MRGERVSERKRDIGRKPMFWAVMILTALVSSQAWALQIDPFSVDQAKMTLTYTGGGSINSFDRNNAGPDASILGGYRHLYIKLLSGSTPNATVTAQVSGGKYSYGSEPDLTGEGYILWNGDSALGPNTLTGLPTLSLNLNLSSQANRFVLNVDFVESTFSTIIIDVIDMAGNTSSCPPVNITTTGLYTILFSSFAGSADFTTVGAIRVRWSGPAAVDFQLEALDAPCDIPAPTVASFTASPNVQSTPQLTTLCWTSFNAQGNPIPVTFRIVGLSGGAVGYSWNGNNSSVCPTTTPSSLPASYRLTLVGLCDNSTYTANIQGEPSRVPSLNEWGMIILSLILAASAVWFLRRRKTN